MSFWDIIWFIIVSFAFIAYLMVLFNILYGPVPGQVGLGEGQGGVGDLPDLLPVPDRLVY